MIHVVIGNMPSDWTAARDNHYFKAANVEPGDRADVVDTRYRVYQSMTSQVP